MLSINDNWLICLYIYYKRYLYPEQCTVKFNSRNYKYLQCYKYTGRCGYQSQLLYPAFDIIPACCTYYDISDFLSTFAHNKIKYALIFLWQI